jgi:hypothetical protein
VKDDSPGTLRSIEQTEGTIVGDRQRWERRISEGADQHPWCPSTTTGSVEPDSKDRSTSNHLDIGNVHMKWISGINRNRQIRAKSLTPDRRSIKRDRDGGGSHVVSRGCKAGVKESVYP